MKINGTIVRRVEQTPPAPSFDIYQVSLIGGPYDGCQTLAGNTTTVYHGTARYKLNEAGDFTYAPEKQN